MAIPAVSVQEMRNIDAHAVALGVDVVQMMEHAGRAVAEQARQLSSGPFTVLCGKGNNGGDGLVAARFLREWGFQVSIVLAFLPKEGNALVQKHIRTAQATGQTIGSAIKPAMDATLLIDGLIGYNLRGNPRGRVATLIELANRTGKDILAIDCPSGLDSDTGRVGRPCITAAVTLALTLPKRGLFLGDAETVTGRVRVADMGVPHEAYAGLTIPRLFRSAGIVDATSCHSRAASGGI